MKLVIIYYTVTQHKPSVRMDSYIDFNDSYIFLTATYIFFISWGTYHYFVKAAHAKFSPFPPAIPLSTTCAK